MFSRRGKILFLVSTILFGGTFVAAKAGLAHFPPLLFVAVRFDIGAVVLAVYAVRRLSWAELRPRTPGDILGIIATGGLVIGLTNALLFFGQQYTTSGVAAVIFSLNPILTPVFVALLLSEDRLSVRAAIGMIFGLLGVGLVAGLDPVALLDGGLGIPILFAGAVTSALGVVVIRRAGAELSSTARTIWGVPLAAVLSHTLSFSAGESVPDLAVPPVAIVALLYVGVFSGAIAYIAFFGLVDETGATQANLIFYFIPIVSAIGGWALLGETLSLMTLAGFGVIFCGYLLINGPSGIVVAIRRGLGNQTVRSGS